MPRIIENPQAIILEHAGRILDHQGYEALSMRAIAKSCGIATGTIYNYFPAKRDLLLQMMTDYWEKHFIEIDNLSASQDDLLSKLKKIFVIMESFILHFREVWTAMRQERENRYETEEFHQNHDSINKLTEKLEMMLLAEEQQHPAAWKYPLPARELAGFIIQNNLAICHMKTLSYSAWEQLLLKLLS